jgi:HAMP domain-containing protein/putative methionine-R-sulfoxide reductase with GAF domain
LVVSLSLLSASYNARWDDVRERQQSLAQQLAGQVAATIDEIQQALDVVGQTSNWQALDPAGQRTLVHTLHTYRKLALSDSGFGTFDEVLLLDGEGQPVAGYSQSRVMSLAAWAEEVRSTAFETVMNGEVYRGPVYISGAAVQTIDIAVPARDLPGRINGLFWAGISLDKALWPIIAAPGVPGDTLVYLFDEQGYLVARNDTHIVQRDEALGGLTPVQDMIKGASQGVATYEGVGGEEVVGAWQPVEGLGWTVVVELPTALAWANVYRLLTPAVALLLITLVGAVLAGVFVSHLLTQPVEHLRAGAEIIGAGNLEYRIQVDSQDEIGSLAQAFNNMAERLRGVVGGLERRVAERTEELNRRATQLQAAAEVSRDAGSVLQPELLVRQTVDLIRDRFGYYYVGLFLLDPAGEWAVLRAGTGVAGREMLMRGHKLAVGGGSMIGWCTAHGRARIALDVGAEAVRFDNPLLPETRSEMALPLISRDRVIGALTVQSAEPQAFSEEDIMVLQTMSDQIANAIATARLLQEAERRAQRDQMIAQVSGKLREALDMEGVLQTTVRELGLALGASEAVVRLGVPASPARAGDKGPPDAEEVIA